MTPAEAARLFERAAKRLPGEIQAAEARSLADLKAAAERRSQGPLQPEDLRKLGHPYSLRRPTYGRSLARRYRFTQRQVTTLFTSGRLDPDVINRWHDPKLGGGTFQASWRIKGPQLKGGAVVSEMWNDAPQAFELESGLVHGRHLMVYRKPHLAAFEDIRAERERRLADVRELIFR